MVAPGKNTPPIIGPTPNPNVRTMGYGPVRLTVTDALKMVQQGIIPEDARVELLEGSLVYRDRFDLRGSEVVEGTKHSYVISALARLSIEINNDRRELRTQSTLVCKETHAPIPDGVVLRGTLEDYRDRLPAASDALCVVEVADSSYERDTGEKLAAYAEAGILQYIVINLRNRTAEVFTGPDQTARTYPPPKIIFETESLDLWVGENEIFSVALRELFP